MRYTFIVLGGVMSLSIPAVNAAGQSGMPSADAQAQVPAECAQLSGNFQVACVDRARKAARKAKANPAETESASPDCTGYRGAERTTCLTNAKNAAAAAKKGGTPGLSKADATLVNNTNAAAQAKLNANDFAGAAAEYQKGIDASPNNPARHVLYAGLAVALRRQAVAAYNSGTRPTPPEPGASNDTIRAFNAAVAAAQTERNAATLPLLKRAIEAAATAATAADASNNKAADPAIGLELREDASLLYRLDTRGVLTTPRPSADLEVTWLKRWMAATNPLPEDQAGRYGFATAATLTAKDPAAGLALADEIQPRAGTGADSALAYAEIVAAAKTPAGDPHRAKALAGLTAVEATLTDGGQRSQASRLKTALAAPN